MPARCRGCGSMFSHTTDRLRAGRFIEKVEQKRHRRFRATGWARRGPLSVIEISDPEYRARERQTEKQGAPRFVSCRGRIWPPINLELGGGGEDEAAREEEQEDEGEKKGLNGRSERGIQRARAKKGSAVARHRRRSGERGRLLCCCGCSGDDSEVLPAITPTSKTPLASIT